MFSRPAFRSLQTTPLTRLRIHQHVPTRAFHPSTRLATESQPALLPTLKADLKTSMRSKDKPRLDTLRSLLAAITNLSKTSKPVSSDAAMLSLLQSHIKTCNESLANFAKADRQDLVDKEKVQLGILEGYAAQIEVVGREEVDGVVADVVREVREKRAEGEVKVGECMGKVMARLGGRPVDSGMVRERVESACKEA